MSNDVVFRRIRGRIVPVSRKSISNSGRVRKGIHHFDQELLEQIGKNAKNLRSTTGLSLNKFAAVQGLSRSIVHRIESGNGSVTLTSLFRYAEGSPKGAASLLKLAKKVIK